MPLFICEIYWQFLIENFSKYILQFFFFKCIFQMHTIDFIINKSSVHILWYFYIIIFKHNLMFHWNDRLLSVNVCWTFPVILSIQTWPLFTIDYKFALRSASIRSTSNELFHAYRVSIDINYIYTVVEPIRDTSIN